MDAARDGIFFHGFSIFALDVDFALAFGNLAVFHHAVNFADDRRVFGLARFEEFDDHQVGARGHQVFLGASARATDVDGGLVLFIAGGQRDDELRKPGDFVHLFLDGDAGLEVLELDRAGGFREDREGVGIPFDHGLAERDGLPIFDLEAGAIDDMVALLLAVFLVHHGDEAGAVHGDNLFAAPLDDFQVDKFHEAVVAGLDLGLFGDASGRAADVEGAHGELRARLADGLRGNDADGFAHFDEAARGQIAAIAAAANSAA